MTASSDDGSPLPMELCSKSGGFEVTPEQAITVALDEAVDRFEDAGLDVVTNAGVLLVVDAGSCEVSVFESGRLLVKTHDEATARGAVRAVYDALEVPL